jgi:hypothetical protein
MKIQNLLLFAGAIALSAHSVNAGEFKTRVVASGLNRPTGIVAGGDELYFTEIPNPGTPNAGNGVKRLDLCDWTVTTVNTGEPEPVNITMDRHGQIYWTCRTAGVILTQDDDGETTPVLRGLSMPSGIAVDRWGRVFFTQIPTPGVPGTMGGSNNVAVLSRDGVNILNMGEPEPQDIAVSRKGELYWTCKTAGVILERDARGQVGVLLGGLNHPTGIALNRQGNRLYWTEVPTPACQWRQRRAEQSLGTQSEQHEEDARQCGRSGADRHHRGPRRPPLLDMHLRWRDRRGAPRPPSLLNAR